MKSKITIDMDWDNQPIIKIQYEQSDDVRDKMVKRFMETFGGESMWATFSYDGVDHDKKICKIRPIGPNQLPEYSSLMKDDADRVKSMWPVPVKNRDENN